MKFTLTSERKKASRLGQTLRAPIRELMERYVNQDVNYGFV